jgi:hypothetical protein
VKRYALCFLVLLAFGLAKLPLERALTRDLHAAHFLEYQLNLDVRAQAGQMGFVAALSGYRAVVADFLWIKAYVAWTRTEWGRMKFLMDAVTTLQPRATTFWDQASWHMAWNAGVAARDNPRQPNEKLRLKAEREYIEIGKQYLLDGIKHNPDRAVLFESLGHLYEQKLYDHCRAAQAYEQAAKRPDAMPYVRRFAVYELARCPGHEREAYDRLIQLYRESKNERLPTPLKLIERLQKELNIPESERIDITQDLKEATPR